MTHRTLAFAAAIGLIAAIVAAPTQAADSEAGAKVFKKCKACHTLDEGGKNKIGPNLFGIIGKQAGSTEGFNYSKAFKKADFTWDEAELGKYLSNPRKYLKGNKMAFPGLKKPEDVENVLAYIMASGG